MLEIDFLHWNMNYIHGVDLLILGQGEPAGDLVVAGGGGRKRERKERERERERGSGKSLLVDSAIEKKMFIFDLLKQCRSG